MYLAIDIGGTKTLLATFTESGLLHEQVRFATPKEYKTFLSALGEMLEGLSTSHYKKVCVAVPGKVDRKRGIGVAFGNLDWHNVPIKADIKKLVDCPTLIENDANLAGLSEAYNVIDEYKRVLYLTISTGIGSGIIINGIIDPDFADSEAGHMMVQYNDKMQSWEHIASGSAIKKRYGKIAADISDKKTWQDICHRLAIGINSLIATMQPEIIILGGGVGSHFNKYGKTLVTELKKYSTPLTPVPPIQKAKHAEEAVVYGCYHLARTTK